MRRPCLAAGVLLVLVPGARADRLPERADQVVDYRIAVRLDATTRELDGALRLVWRNPSADHVPDLWFHLYLNAFKSSRTTFSREDGGRSRLSRALTDRWGWIDVTSLRLPDGTDLLPTRTFEHPDDDNPSDRTVMRVRLPRPVPPGGAVELDIAFRARLPRMRARTGYVRDHFLVGQWFPKLGVYEPAGTRGRAHGGWNCHQLHARSEFYADFGRYRVEITLPSRFVVGATGRRTARGANGDGTTTHTYEQSDVHDFAWTADPGFVEVERTFSAAAEVTEAEYAEAARLLGRTLDDVRLGDVEITFLMQRGRLPQLDRLVRAATLALKHFGLWYGPYPYPTLTVVDPAPGAGASAGMEYPTFVTGGSSLLFNRWPLAGARLPEETIVHEIGHQWWYGLVGSNEFEEAWLDEGMTSYATGRVMERAHGRDASLADLLGLRLGSLELARMGNGPHRVFDGIRQPAWKYSSAGAYGFNAYSRPDLALRTLEGILGAQTMARLMRTYHERWRFRHPGSDDFFAVAEEVSGRDLGWFFGPVFGGTGLLDYEVASVATARVPEARGVLDGEGGRETVLDREARRREEEADEKEARPYESSVLVRRRGEIVVPVDVELRFAGAPPERLRWDGRERWVRYVRTRPERLLSAHVDPEKLLPLDVSVLDNAKRVEGDARAAAHWGARWLFWIQQLLATVGM